MAPATRPLDTLKVELIADNTQAGGVFDNFTSIEVRTDITMPSEASFEVGDDGTWPSAEDLFAIGKQYQVFVNDRPRMRGRVEMNDNPVDPGAGAVVRFVVRTKLADAMIASALQSVRVQNVSIKQFVLELYKPLQYREADFVFAQQTSRNLLTGRRTTTGEKPKDLEPIKIDEARVKPGETIYAAADRHLRRHGLMHWDSPDGRIVVGTPNDTQDPTYTFNLFRTYAGGNPDLNNVLSGSRFRDWSGVPGVVGVYGVGGKRDFTKSRIAARADDLDVIRAGFYRPVAIVAEGIRTQELALRSALRELSARSKRKDGFEIEVDGFSYWDGHKPTLYAVDTVAQVNTDVAGGNAGAYYVHAVTMQRSADRGDVTQLELVKRGIWRL
jgi:prophage tail gpP-like protein